MTDHTHSPAKTTATPGIVSGGGHVYPSTRQGLASYRGHMSATESQKQRDFQAIREEASRGGRGEFVYKKIVSRRYPTPESPRFKAFYFPGVLGTSAVWPSGPDGEPGPGKWVGNGASENAR